MQVACNSTLDVRVHGMLQIYKKCDKQDCNIFEELNLLDYMDNEVLVTVYTVKLS